MWLFSSVRVTGAAEKTTGGVLDMRRSSNVKEACHVLRSLRRRQDRRTDPGGVTLVPSGPIQV